MTGAKTYNEITGLQRSCIREAARIVGCKESDMVSYFLAGGDWDCKPGDELEELLVECWNESNPLTSR